jgi:hypothetical protein
MEIIEVQFDKKKKRWKELMRFRNEFNTDAEYKAYLKEYKQRKDKLFNE